MAEPLFADSDLLDDGSAKQLALVSPASDLAWATPKAARVSISPPALEWDLKRAPQPSQSLWHRVQKVVFYSAQIRNLSDEPALFRVSVESDAASWNPEWLRLWPQKTGAATRGADETSWLLELEAGGSADFRVEIEARLDESARTGDFAWELVAYQAQIRSFEESGGLSESVPERRVGGALALLRLQHPDSRLLNLLPAIYQEAMLDLRRQSDARLQDWEEAIATPLDNTARPMMSLAVPSTAQSNALAQRLRPLGNIEAPFFERFLLGFEDANAPLQAQVAELFRTFDPRETPLDFLPWLSQWVGLAFEGAWPELQRRQLLLHALRLYAWRGTRQGMTELLQLFTGVTPEIADAPTKGLVLGQARFGDESNARLGGLGRHCFTVTLSVPDPGSLDRAALVRLIESQKPAHTAFTLHILRSSASVPVPATSVPTAPAQS